MSQDVSNKSNKFASMVSSFNLFKVLWTLWTIDRRINYYFNCDRHDSQTMFPYACSALTFSFLFSISIITRRLDQENSNCISDSSLFLFPAFMNLRRVLQFTANQPLLLIHFCVALKYKLKYCFPLDLSVSLSSPVSRCFVFIKWSFPFFNFKGHHNIECAARNRIFDRLRNASFKWNFLFLLLKDLYIWRFLNNMVSCKILFVWKIGHELLLS